jgi:hypothetical protein
MELPASGVLRLTNSFVTRRTVSGLISDASCDPSGQVIESSDSTARTLWVPSESRTLPWPPPPACNSSTSSTCRSMKSGFEPSITN